MGLFGVSKKKQEIAAQQRRAFRERIEEEIINYVQEEVDYEDISMECTLYDLGMDELDLSVMVAWLEDTVNVRTEFSLDDDELLHKLKTLEDVVDYFLNFM